MPQVERSAIVLPEQTLIGITAPHTISFGLLRLCSIPHSEIVVVVSCQIVIHISVKEISKSFLCSRQCLVKILLARLITNGLQALDEGIHIFKQALIPLIALLVNLQFVKHCITLTQVGKLRSRSNLQVGNLNAGVHSCEGDEIGTSRTVTNDSIIKGLPFFLQFLCGIGIHHVCCTVIYAITITGHSHKISLERIGLDTDSSLSSALHLVTDDISIVCSSGGKLEVHTLTGSAICALDGVDAGGTAVGINVKQEIQCLLCRCTDECPSCQVSKIAASHIGA